MILYHGRLLHRTRSLHNNKVERMNNRMNIETILVKQEDDQKHVFLQIRRPYITTRLYSLESFNINTGTYSQVNETTNGVLGTHS